MKTLLLGVGRQGERILDLLIEQSYTGIHLFDIRKEVLKRLQAKYEKKVNLTSQNFFKLDENRQIEFLQNFDFIIDALPAQFSYILFSSL